MKIYINGSSAISACHVFNTPYVLTEPVRNSVDRLSCNDPDYDKILEPSQIRRLSRILKMGLATSLDAIKQADNKGVDAIITGTGYGFLEDTARFLFKMTDPEDRGMNPTSFIQSTFNTISSLIALSLKNNGYNNTFTHSGFSFESALDDAIMLLKAGDAKNVLVGGLDELTDEVYNLLKLLQQATSRGTKKTSSWVSSEQQLLGEGSSFFVLSDRPDSPFPVEITSYNILYDPDNDQIRAGFEECRGNFPIDLFLLGRNEGKSNDKSYDWILSQAGRDKCFNYKRLCGDYPTAFSFGLWLATTLLSGSAIPFISNKKTDNILIYNCFEQKYHAFLSLRRF
jgi:3-oxoacyl-[acyl-carrier-protein] synthase II